MSPNIELLSRVARRLAPLLTEIAFVGGSVMELYVTSPVSEKVRPTADTDVVCEVTSRGEYRALGDRLQALGFGQSALHNDPPYRWRCDGDRLDVLPSDESVLGFSNPWFKPGLEHAVPHSLATGNRIRGAADPAARAGMDPRGTRRNVPVKASRRVPGSSPRAQDKPRTRNARVLSHPAAQECAQILSAFAPMRRFRRLSPIVASPYPLPFEIWYRRSIAGTSPSHENASDTETRQVVLG